MTTITEQKGVVSTSAAKTLALLALGLFGALLIGGVGFAGTPTIHDAAHDVRHTMGFPCH
ncbi:CbtB-domain containing protein [Rhizobiaceae bacterium n13]|uniref:CbtB-domain containing protein n=1 Tax=Ferirhizobium litorale TaxID=2927786 RepID=A0AAE3QAM1_9HYPH|nr:CbtB domain-containing protein [Fererhizobium litorale]MDI7860333.1 CbtB-domain containing protein [Fererhizobium litorale]MDI7920468.1 CbtB-domain containing protein [Fererhizobium litorale]